MEIDTSLDSLRIFEALASDTRLKIINLLAERECNIKEIANELYLSSSIVTRHIKKLENANIIKTTIRAGTAGSQKICALTIDQMFIRFPKVIYPQFKKYSSTIKLGHFFDFDVKPTCGLATPTNYIGVVDEPMYFMDANRMSAELLWFSEGFVEYKIPNMLKDGQIPELLELSLELSSEFPESNNNWPSDISFFINDTFVGKWTVPGNFSDVKGRLNPAWWPAANSQYGLLKTLRITKNQIVMDSEVISNKTIKDIEFDNSFVKIRIAVNSNSENVGGVTIFGNAFGNHKQDINYNLFYSGE